MPMQEITGTIALEGAKKLSAGTKAYVFIEDVSLADAASTVVAAQVLVIKKGLKAGETLKFAVKADFNDRADYSVRVHIDTNHDGVLSKGDFITQQSYPVATRGAPKNISVMVKKI